jgi:DNA mismatch endonuclease (patch repair protein)
MAGIARENTQPELAVRRLLHGLGFRFRLHRADLPGTPDIVLPSRQAAIFVHGCFWHRHSGCRFAAVPKSRQDFWEGKIAATKARDRLAIRELRRAGWRVAVVWECETRKPDGLAKRLCRFLKRE